jgi:hypothetical protein
MCSIYANNLPLLGNGGGDVNTGGGGGVDLSSVLSAFFTDLSVYFTT